MRSTLLAMIVGISLAGGNALAAGKLPDATGFVVQMEAGNLAQAEEWLNDGLPPDFMGSRIGSGMMIGAWEGNLPLMELFLKRGADINRANSNGETALALAAWKGRREAVDWLLARGASLNGKPRQWTALHYAAFAGHKELAESLVARGADLNALTPNGSSPLMMAIYDGHEEMAKFLIDKGARRDFKNDWGDGAMEWAMRFDRLKIAEWLATPQEFKAAMNEPRQKWGEAKRSLAMSSELEQLFRARSALAAKGMPLETVDNRIAAERARIVRREFNRQALPPRAARLEITANAQKPEQQSAKLVGGGTPADDSKYKVPPATYSGTPRMPAKMPTKNY